MTFASPEPVVSGMPYTVTAVSGRGPSSLEEFVGATEFTVDKGAVPYVVWGSGALSGDLVRFHEKDKGPDGKDIRVWQITRRPDGFAAESVAMY
jgi:hypothetical protein